MKRFILTVVALILLIACVSCQTEEFVPIVLPTPTPTTEPTPAPTPEPTPAPTPTPVPDALTVSDSEYTIAWISDTQYYSRSFPETYYRMTDFLSGERDRLGLEYIVHTGDLVNNLDDEAQWDVAVGAQSAIDDIPGGVLAGNHDVGHEDDDYSYYRKYFGEQKYASKPWYGGSYKDNRGHFDLMDIGSTKYIFVYMGYIQSSDSLKWLKETFLAYPDRVGVLCVHDYLDTDSTLTGDGELLYKKVVSACPNIYLVLCGHRYNIDCLTAEFDDSGDGTPDRTVYQMIGNYQAAGAEGGSGYMKFLQINESADTIELYSYSPLLDDYVYFDEPERQEEKYATPPERETLVLDIPWIS